MTGRLWDIGAQAERTALAWQRTGLTAIVVGALLIRALGGTDALAPLPGVLLMATGSLAAVVLAPARYQRVLQATKTGRTPVAPAAVASATVVVVVVTVVVG